MNAFAAGRSPFLVFENSGFFVLYKPGSMHSARPGRNRNPSAIAGAVTATGSDSSGLATNLLDWIDAAVPRLADASMPGGEYGMLSRLDFDTSGLILFAKDPGLFSLLRGRARSPEYGKPQGRASGEALLDKRYRLLAFSGGVGLPGSRPLLLPAPGTLPFTVSSRFRSYGIRGSKVACIAQGQEGFEKKPFYPELCHTRFEASVMPSVVEECSIPAGSFCLEATLQAGFRHQIRAHCAWLGFPILGDLLYGGAPAGRLCLEACALDIRLPGSSILHIDLYEKEKPYP
jgi:hypothetical protein